MEVMIDGKRYVPADMSPPAEAMKLLAQVYGRLWTEAYYDAFNKSTEDFARPLAELMSKANDVLGFKQ